jgi:sugar lactone lactonase YvrE
MSNNRDFIVKNAVEVGGATKVTLGDAAAAGSYTQGYDLSVAAYDSVSFSVAAQETLPQGMDFKPDGTIMYIIGSDTDRVKQYTLSTAWDLTTASYASKDFSVSGQSTVPQGMAISTDGTKLYVVGDTGDRIIQYTLSTAWDISTASYTQRVDVSAQSPVPTDVHFKPDGTKMYIVESNGDQVEEYDLSTAWDISTITHNQSLSISSEDTSPIALTFNSDGTKMFMMGLAGDDVNEYTLSTAWDISTAVFVTNFSVTTQENSPRGLAFKSDGTKMYVVGATNDRVYQYSTGSTVTTGSFDLSTGNYFTDTPSADVEYTFSNAGDVQTVQVEVTGASTYTVTWPTSVQWAGGTAPDSPAAGEKDLYTITTDDGGTTYFGVQSGDAFS